MPATPSPASATLDVAPAPSDVLTEYRRILDDHVVRGCSDVSPLAAAFATKASTNDVLTAYAFATRKGTTSSQWSMAEMVSWRTDARAVLERAALSGDLAPLDARALIATAVIAAPDALPQLFRVLDDERASPESAALAARGVARIFKWHDVPDDAAVDALVARLETLMTQHKLDAAVAVAAAIETRWPLPEKARATIATDLETLARLVGEGATADALRMVAANARVDDSEVGRAPSLEEPLPTTPCAFTAAERATYDAFIEASRL